MMRISTMLVSLLILASIALGFISPASAMTRGQAIDKCRELMVPAMNDYYARLAIDACVQRLLSGAPD